MCGSKYCKIYFGLWILPVPIPNVKEVAEKMVASMKPSGIIFTGGNSLVKYGGDAPERDETERYLLQQALEQKIPVYGFCRGMQSILDFYDCALQEVTGHVAVKHVIDGTWGKREVNSFHNQACLSVKDPVEVLAKQRMVSLRQFGLRGKNNCNYVASGKRNRISENRYGFGEIIIWKETN